MARKFRCSKVGNWFRQRENILLVATIAGVFLGVGVGLIVRIFNPSAEAARLVGFPGEIFMNMLKVITIPLLVASLISGIASLEARSAGKIAALAISYYLVTTIIATITGIALVLLIHPGSPDLKPNTSGPKQERRMTVLDAILDLIRNLVPDNIFRATFQQVQTVYEKEPYNSTSTNEVYVDFNWTSLQEPNIFVLAYLVVSNGTHNLTILNVTRQFTREVPKINYQNGSNVLGLVAFSIFIGIVLSILGHESQQSQSKSKSPSPSTETGPGGEKGKEEEEEKVGLGGDGGRAVRDFFISFNDVVMRMIRYVMVLSPVGIFFLILGKILEIPDFAALIRQLGLYFLTVMAGLVIHQFITLMLIYFVFTRKNPYSFFYGMFQAIVTAIGTSSSSATLPVTFRCLEENLKIHPKITRFMLPIGATINMDGTALYEAVAAIFIAQLNGINLNIGQVITISITATLASIGAASIPSAGLVTMIIVLNSVGLPTEDISIIVAIDWLLDRFRTAVNVLGDAYGAGIVAHLCRKELAASDALAAIAAEQTSNPSQVATASEKLQIDDSKAIVTLANGNPVIVRTNGGTGPQESIEMKGVSIASRMEKEGDLGEMVALGASIAASEEPMSTKRSGSALKTNRVAPSDLSTPVSNDLSGDRNNYAPEVLNPVSKVDPK